ncbi:hypothetical protein HWV62_8953 [Athelia sp. TMB]|nr:hypothetical protein HWV62_8953 [Athelia sp. TMB]
MAPNLQGLNIVHSPLHASGSQDLLAPSYPDLSAQLDLWTNLAFESDEPLEHAKHKRKNPSAPASHEEDDEDEYLPRAGVAPHDAHENVVTGTSVDGAHSPSHPHQHNQQNQGGFDLNHLLAGFGIDPFAPQAGGMPSLAQLLSVHGSQGIAFPSMPPPAPSEQDHSRQETPAPPAKRARSRKASVSVSVTESEPYSPDGANTTTPASASEDKRRRNTAASARFRMKKKEREAALEARAKELEGRVGELERECEGLRRENGWLKGLVVGVTGAQPGAIGSVGGGGGKKRSRDEAEGGKH